jgi:hypothetical protein
MHTSVLFLWSVRQVPLRDGQRGPRHCGPCRLAPLPYLRQSACHADAGQAGETRHRYCLPHTGKEAPFIERATGSADTEERFPPHEDGKSTTRQRERRNRECVSPAHTHLFSSLETCAHPSELSEESVAIVCTSPVRTGSTASLPVVFGSRDAPTGGASLFALCGIP